MLGLQGEQENMTAHLQPAAWTRAGGGPGSWRQQEPVGKRNTTEQTCKELLAQLPEASKNSLLAT